MSLKIYVVGGNGAYFNYQQSSTPGIEWMFEIYFDAAGTGTINAGGLSAATFTYTPDSWTDFNIIVDLDNDSAEVSIDANSVYKWQWSQTATGGGTDAPMWGGMDIFASAPAGQTADFYIDDVVLSQIFGTGVLSNEANASLDFTPNPSNGNFTLRGINIPAGEYRMDVVDVTGKVISSETLQVAGTLNKAYHLNITKGVYFVTLNSETYSQTKKVIIE
jgi:hypothetical protein